MDDHQNEPAAPVAAPIDRLVGLPKPATAVEARSRLIDMLRRDLIGPHPDLDHDLVREVLAGSSPTTWYLTGYLGPRRKTGAAGRRDAIEGSDTAKKEIAEDMLEALRGSEGMEQGAPCNGVAADDASSERPPTRSFEPSSMGLTVLLPRDARSLKARVTWGDYVTEPRLEEAVFMRAPREEAEARGEKPTEPKKNSLRWRRIPREEWLTIHLQPSDKPQIIVVPNSAAPMASGGGLQLVVSARLLVCRRPQFVRRLGCTRRRRPGDDRVHK